MLTTRSNLPGRFAFYPSIGISWTPAAHPSQKDYLTGGVCLLKRASGIVFYASISSTGKEWAKCSLCGHLAAACSVVRNP